MKKIFSILVVLLGIALAGCSSNKATTAANQAETAVTLDNNESLALSAYLASNVLTSSLNTASMSFDNNQYLPRLMTETTNSNSNGFVIDPELDVVNVYFDMLKTFMDNGVSSVLTINEAPSTMAGYDTEVTYTIDGVTYTIYYSVVVPETTEPVDTTQPETTVPATTTADTNVTTETSAAQEPQDTETDEPGDNEEADIENEQQFELTGLMVIDGVEYQLQGQSKVEDGETKMWFEAVDPNNTDNTVRVQIKNEEEQQRFELLTNIDGVEKSSEVRFTQDENLTKVTLNLFDGQTESNFKFMKVVEDGVTMYKLDYQIGDTKGQVKIQEITDENGNVTYRYKIQENGRNKEEHKNKEHHNGHGDSHL